MEKIIIKIDPFKIIGIAIETTNQNGQSGQDMGILWDRFFREEISQKIPNKINDDIYAIYTDYESGYQGKHTAIIGCPVTNLDTVPGGLIGREFESGQYQEFIAKGTMPMAVQQTWQHIWAKDNVLERNYSADFEIYEAKSQLGDKSEVNIFIGIQ